MKSQQSKAGRSNSRLMPALLVANPNFNFNMPKPSIAQPQEEQKKKKKKVVPAHKAPKSKSSKKPHFRPSFKKKEKKSEDIAVAVVEVKPVVEVKRIHHLDPAPDLPKWVEQALDPASPDSPGKQRVLNDGITHINIGGRTVLGSDLSHFSNKSFKHPYYGPFNCMEGLWQYLKSENPDDSLRTLVGYRAKFHGKQLPEKLHPRFKEIIIAANYYRIEQHPEMKQMLMESTLPFDHYYLYGDGNLLIRRQSFEWLIQGFEEIRKMFLEGRVPDPIDYNSDH